MEWQSSFKYRILTLIDENEELPPLFPLSFLDYVGFGFAILGLMLAAGGGIGGGGILIPIYILILNFPVKHAIPLASVTVLGGSLANNMLNFRKKHPIHNSRSLVDWDLILQLEPMTIAGALIGADLNDLLPDIVLVVLLLLLLSITAYKTLAKACKLYNQESKMMEVETRTALINNNGDELFPVAGTRGYGAVSASTADHSDGVDIQRRSVRNAIQLTILFTVITVLNILKGGPEMGGSGPLALNQCDETCFWLVEGAMILIILGFCAYVRSRLLSDVQKCRQIPSDIEWNEDNTIRYPTFAVLAGLVAGMFGVGGGIIKGPLMLALGVHPAVASGTSACMILYTSATATICFHIFGLLVWDYSVMCLVIGFASTLLGQTVMNTLLATYKRDSYIAFSIGLVVAVSAVCMSVESILQMSEHRY